MILSVDFGTSALKLSVLNTQLQILAGARSNYPYTVLPGEKIEQDPWQLLRAMEKCCVALPEDLRQEIDLICYDTFAPSLMLLDSSGFPLYPVVTHLDRRSRKQSDMICRMIGKEHYRSIAGTYPFTGGVSLTNLLWFMENMPQLQREICHIGHLPTFIHYQLTGKWMIDLANASMLGVYDTVGESGWSQEILSAFQIPQSWLPPIVPSGQLLGALTADMAARLGLRAGIPVATGTHDVVAAHAGAGNTRAGQVLNTAGSSDMISILTDKPILHERHYVRSGGKKGLWQIYGTTSGGFAIEWFRKQFCTEMEENEFYKEYLPHCASLGGGRVWFKPYLAEDRQSLERRLAGWEGLSLGTTRDEMLGALLHAMQQELGKILQTAAQLIPLDKCIKVTGGIASEAILDLKRRIFGDYLFVQKDNCPILGNAQLALCAKEHQPPIPDAVSGRAYANTKGESSL